MKRAFCWLLLLMLCMALPAQASKPMKVAIDGAGLYGPPPCEHAVCIRSSAYQERCVCIDTALHARQVYFDIFCEQCQADALTFIYSSQLESHDWKLAYEFCDPEGEGHTLVLACTGCSARDDTTYPCSGFHGAITLDEGLLKEAE